MEVSILLIFLIICFMCIFKVNVMKPVGLICTMWIAFIVGSLLFLKLHYEFSYKGINWILGMLLLLLISSLPFDTKLKRSKNRENTSRLPDIPWNLLKLFVMMGFVKILYDMVQNGISISAFGSFSALMDVSQKMSAQRYADNNTTSVIGQLLGLFIYVAPICCGYSYVFAKKKKEKIICFSSIIPVILLMLLTSAKLALVSYVIFFFTGFYVAYIYKNKRPPRINLKIVYRTGMGFVVLLTLFYLSFVLRIGTGETNLFQIIIEKIAVYAFGHIQGFDLWFSSKDWNVYSYGWGANTLMSISSFLGLRSRTMGIYKIMPGSCTNVYTQLRQLIEDFGPILSIIVFIILGVIASMCYNKLVTTSKVKLFTQLIFSTIIFYFLFFTITCWTYTTFILVFFMFGCFLYVSYSKKLRHFLEWRKSK